MSTLRLKSLGATCHYPSIQEVVSVRVSVCGVHIGRCVPRSPPRICLNNASADHLQEIRGECRRQLQLQVRQMRRLQDQDAISSDSTNLVDFHLKFFLEICHEADIGHMRYGTPAAVSVSVGRVAMLRTGGSRVLFQAGAKYFLFSKAT